nr:hypothetical protein [uncultured Deefgea sp.]
MSHIFDMSSGKDLSTTDRVLPSKTIHNFPQQELALRLLTVAESEEQQPIPRPRPWLKRS